MVVKPIDRLPIESRSPAETALDIMRKASDLVVVAAQEQSPENATLRQRFTDDVYTNILRACYDPEKRGVDDELATVANEVRDTFAFWFGNGEEGDQVGERVRDMRKSAVDNLGTEQVSTLRGSRMEQKGGAADLGIVSEVDTLLRNVVGEVNNDLTMADGQPIQDRILVDLQTELDDLEKRLEATDRTDRTHIVLQTAHSTLEQFLKGTFEPEWYDQWGVRWRNVQDQLEVFSLDKIFRD